VEDSKITITTHSAEINFTWDELRNEWFSIHYFSGWSGFNFENRLPELKDGQAYLIVETYPGQKPSVKHIQALTWLLDQPDAASQIVLNAIYPEYPQRKNSLKDYFDDDLLNSLYPNLTSVYDLKKLLSLSRIHLYEESKGGLPYLGFDLECNWDVEHGMQVFINGPRIVQAWAAGLNPAYIDKDGGKI